MAQLDAQRARESEAEEKDMEQRSQAVEGSNERSADEEGGGETAKGLRSRGTEEVFSPPLIIAL